MLRIGIVGAGGRMGQALKTVIDESPEADIVQAVGRKEATEVPFPVVQLEEASFKQADIWIDFSHPQVFAGVLEKARKAKVPLVSGTTGLTAAHFDLMGQACQEIPVLWAPNMSLGVVWLERVLGLAQQLDGYEFQVSEIHHRHKKDCPSGTAVRMQQILKDQQVKLCGEPFGVRAAEVFGMHRIMAFGPDETITIEHQAQNRQVFARGALQAAFFLKSQASGQFSMTDVLEGRT